MKGTNIKEKILVVEDQPQVVHLVTEVLQAVGYDVIHAADGDAAVEMTALEQPALILLDIMFPQGPDGLAVCRHIRQFSDVPIIMLTARAQENDKLNGFDAGADDYLTKPFSSKELVARVRVALRRGCQPNERITTPLKCGGLVVDFARQSVKTEGRRVSLTRTEYSLLRQLALNPNRVILQGELLKAVWGPEYVDDVDYLRAYIRHLRVKLESDPSNPRYIITSPGIGYMLACHEGE